MLIICTKDLFTDVCDQIHQSYHLLVEGSNFLSFYFSFCHPFISIDVEVLTK